MLITGKETTEISHKGGRMSDSSVLRHQLEMHPIAQKLRQQIFIGEFTGRRYVESLELYRDVILVDGEEQEFIKLLKEFQRLVMNLDKRSRWLGIQCNPYDTKENYVMWVDLKGLIFARHWFQVQSIELKDNEILLELKHLRAIREGTEKASEISTLSDINIKEILTKENVWSALKFSAVLTMMLCSFVVEASQFALDYLIKFINAAARLIDSLTPSFLGTLEFFGRCIAGFYWLILMLCNGNRKTTLSHPQFVNKPLTTRKWR